MGHNRLLKLPHTHRWKQVIELLEIGGSVEEVVDASFHAVQTGFERIPHDPGFQQVFTNIFQFINAAQSKDLARAMHDEGYSIPTATTTFDIVSALREKTDNDLTRQYIKSDVSEIAQNSFAEILIRTVSANVPSLFATTPETLYNIVRQQVSGNNLKHLMHEFYAIFTRRYLSYYLSRELPGHIGFSARLGDIDDHREFNKAFDLYIRQTVRIADEFTPSWFEKERFTGHLTKESVSRYIL